MKLGYEIRFGTFIKRPNRFIAYIDVDGSEVICHVPNTGRLKELLTPGARVLLSYHPLGNRKTRYELRMVMKGEAIVYEVIKEFSGYSLIKREVTYQNSRFDLQLIDTLTMN